MTQIWCGHYSGHIIDVMYSKLFITEHWFVVISHPLHVENVCSMIIHTMMSCQTLSVTIIISLVLLSLLN